MRRLSSILFQPAEFVQPDMSRKWRGRCLVAGEVMGLERGKVVSAALRLLDEVGRDGLTTRRLAEDLGVRGPALYWHFENKQALTDAMAYQILAESRAGVVLEDDWVGLLVGEARRGRKA